MVNPSARPRENEMGRPVLIGPVGLEGFLGLPPDPRGLVIFAHGSGSGRFSPRNNWVARGLREGGLATLLIDLLRPEEELDRHNVFDIPLLASRLVMASQWAQDDSETSALPLGYFGASTGAGAALSAAALPGSRVRAVVSRGGRPDLAQAALTMVRAPTLLIVGSNDPDVLQLNRQAFANLHREKELAIVQGAGHLFEEPGTLDEVVALALRWFLDYLPHKPMPRGVIPGDEVP